MFNFLLVVILIFYLTSVLSVGRLVVRRWLAMSADSLFTLISATIAGLLISIPVTYALAWAWAWTGEGILFGVISYLGLIVLLKIMHQSSLKIKFTVNELWLMLFTSVFATWLMTKSFFVDSTGTWRVARNAVFDTAHTLSLVRSFSWGNNLPFSSPFAAGSTDLYHFFFYFLVAVFERFGVPLVLAVNFLSVVGLAAYLITAYYFVRLILGQKPIVSWLAVILLIGHSTLTWWFFLVKEGLNFSTLTTLWRLPNYLCAGPNDGSPISLFFTLNVFVNQRHLALSLAMATWLLISAALETKPNKILLGILSGLLSLWNLVVCLTLIGVVTLLYFVRKKPFAAISYFFSAVLTGLIFVSPSLHQLSGAVSSGSPGALQLSFWAELNFWFLNLGAGIAAFLLGYLILPKTKKLVMLPLVLLFLPLAVSMAMTRYELAQKMLNFWNIGFVALSACGIAWLWEKQKVGRLLAIVLFLAMSLSGMIDLMVIKNDFAYPAFTDQTQQTVTKIKAVLPLKATVLSFREMYHPVALAGRQQFFGFFSAPEANARAEVSQQIFLSTGREELVRLLERYQITHVLLPKEKIADFPYAIDEQFFRNSLKLVYEDQKYLLLRL